MNWIDTIVVTAVLIAAVAYLIRAARPDSKTGGCACGSTGCKVPKPKLRK